MGPLDLPLVFLEDITETFSDKRKLGSGGYGQVYKGVDKNGKEIAVKKLYTVPGLDDVQFQNEFNSLMMVRHQNIIRLVAYSYGTRHKHIMHKGEFIFGEVIDRVLCLEYLPGGSLDKHLNEESCGHDWPTRLKIITGICEGLNYLHGASIFHLDLKPANILLDKNLMPKIADFGLSRLFNGTQTYTTKRVIGTELYMPPEYITKRQISKKSDVFSLGVMIIQIIAGPEGYSKWADMSSREFVELVQKNWRDRIGGAQMYPSAEQVCQQVKKCIELALSCVEADRNQRPTVQNIIRQLKEIETFNGSAPSRDQARLAKIGQWGGVGGGLCDVEVAPSRLKSLIIGSGQVIYSLEFLFDDHEGRQHTTGPWGGHGPKGLGEFRHRINLGPSEVLNEVHGTYSPADFAPGGVLKSITIITTAGMYGPFGEVKGTPFQIPVRGNGSIVGFFARAGWCIDAFGVYVKPNQKIEEVSIVKIGPWGGNGGQEQDIKAPRRLESVTIHSGTFVNSLAFTYLGHDDQQYTTGPWGGPDGSAHTIHLSSSEFLTGVRGTTDIFGAASADVIVSSLTLVTNIRSYGPFGEGGGTPFQIPMWGKGSIVGFFGRAGSYVNAIGVYVNPDQQAMKEEVLRSGHGGTILM